MKQFYVKYRSPCVEIAEESVERRFSTHHDHVAVKQSVKSPGYDFQMVLPSSLDSKKIFCLGKVCKIVAARNSSVV